MAGPISVNSVCRTSWSRMTLTTCRRLATVSIVACVISCPAYGRRRRALASVVVMRPFSNNACARLARIRRWCEGLPPKRAPLVGVGMNTPLVLLVLGEAGVVIVGLDGGGRVEPSRAVLERETHLRELGLDLVDGLGAEVADVEQVLLRAGDELTHGVDALPLEAVVRADREVEVLDRQCEIGGQLLVDRRRADVDALGFDIELT